MNGYSKSAQIGKAKKKKSQGQINRESNAELDKIYKAKKMYESCEVLLAKNCLPHQIKSYGKELRMTYAHKSKRIKYKENKKKKMHLLKSYNETIRCCIPCHQLIEHDKELTRKLFLKLRPVIK